MWCLGTWFSGGLGSIGVIFGLDVLSNLNDSMILHFGIPIASHLCRALTLEVHWHYKGWISVFSHSSSVGEGVLHCLSTGHIAVIYTSVTQQHEKTRKFYIPNASPRDCRECHWTRSACLENCLNAASVLWRTGRRQSPADVEVLIQAIITGHQWGSGRAQDPAVQGAVQTHSWRSCPCSTNLPILVLDFL